MYFPSLCFCASELCTSHNKADCERLGCNCAEYGCSAYFSGMLIGGGDPFYPPEEKRIIRVRKTRSKKETETVDSGDQNSWNF